MLKSIDILIGLIVVLLALSMAVTVITQTITAILNSRGRHLRRGLVDLLQQLDPALTEHVSKAVATGILTHPLVSGSNTPVAGGAGQADITSIIRRVRQSIGGPRLGNVVHREEFTKLLMAFAAGHGSGQLEGAAKEALQTALKANGVDDPEQVLKKIRQLALQFEKSSPEMSNMARQNLAILHAAETDLVAKINNWFDQTMDRTSQRFTASTRAMTFVGAFLVAFGLQVDTPALVNRLAADDQMRARFVEQAATLNASAQGAASPQANAGGGAAGGAVEGAASADPALANPPADAAPATAALTNAGSQPAAADRDEIARQYRAFLATNGIITLPGAGWREWREGFGRVNPFGMLLTALLLSLGAPFWYSALGRLLQLRSVLAAKDDAQRNERQGSGTPIVPPARPAAVVAVTGERAS